jgi:hypothetical protein
MSCIILGILPFLLSLNSVKVVNLCFHLMIKHILLSEVRQGPLILNRATSNALIYYHWNVTDLYFCERSLVMIDKALYNYMNYFGFHLRKWSMCFN